MKWKLIEQQQRSSAVQQSKRNTHAYLEVRQTYQHHFRHLTGQKVHTGAIAGCAVEWRVRRGVLSTWRQILVTTVVDVLIRNH